MGEDPPFLQLMGDEPYRYITRLVCRPGFIPLGTLDFFPNSESDAPYLEIAAISETNLSETEFSYLLEDGASILLAAGHYVEGASKTPLKLVMPLFNLN